MKVLTRDPLLASITIVTQCLRSPYQVDAYLFGVGGRGSEGVTKPFCCERLWQRKEW